MEIGIALALASAVAYGASDFVGGLGSRRFSPWRVVFVGQLAGAVAMLAAAIGFPGNPGAADFAWALLAGLGSAAGGIFLYRGLARGRMGLVAPVSAVGAAVLPVVAGVVLGDRPGWLAWLGILTALPGIWLVAREGGPGRPSYDRAAILDGAIAGAGFGTLFVALGQISDDAGLLPLAANQLTGAVLTGVAAVALRQAWLPSPGVLGWGAVSGVLGAAATLTFMLATATTDLGIAGVLASLYPAVTVLLAAGLLKERIAPAQWAGIGICTAAVAAIALG